MARRIFGDRDPLATAFARTMEGLPCTAALRDVVRIFGGIGRVLAAAGLFGVVSYAVPSRTREIGLRIALGATTPALLRLVVAQALAIIEAGLVAGLTIAAAVTRFTATLLYDVRPADPITIAAVPLRGMAEPFVAGQHPRVGYRGLQQSPTGPCD